MRHAHRLSSAVHPTACSVALTLLFAGLAGDLTAAPPTSANNLLKTGSDVRFQLVFGRIKAVPRQPQVKKQSASNHTDTFVSQKISVDVQPGRTHIEYASEAPNESLVFAYLGSDNLSIVLENTGEQQSRTVLEQKGSQTTLRVTTPMGSHAVSGSCVWSIGLQEPELFDKHLAPCLARICTGSRPVQTRRRIVEELVRLSSNDRPCEKLVEHWVVKLASEKFRVRRKAEQQLLELGPGVLPYLDRLQANDLDPEQTRRIARVRGHFFVQSPDCCERVAAWLASSTSTWLALLEHRRLEYRQQAYTALCRDCGRTHDTLGFEPNADVRQRQQQIRAMELALANN